VSPPAASTTELLLCRGDAAAGSTGTSFQEVVGEAQRSGGRPRLDRSIRTQHPGTETDPAGSGSGWLVRCSFLGRRARLVPGADAACPFLCLRCPPSPSSGNAMGRRIASHRLRCSSATPICAQPKLLAGSLGEERGQPASQPTSTGGEGVKIPSVLVTAVDRDSAMRFATTRTCLRACPFDQAFLQKDIPTSIECNLNLKFQDGFA
jgi:hypothetical protein